mgnify:CR=1 FL=1
MGSLWAGLSFGRLWSWEPRTIWSTIIRMIYAVLLHGRVTVGWGAGAATLTIVGFGVLFVSFIGVNMLAPGRHAGRLQWSAEEARVRPLRALRGRGQRDGEVELWLVGLNHETAPVGYEAARDPRDLVAEQGRSSSGAASCAGDGAQPRPGRRSSPSRIAALPTSPPG